MGSRIAELLLYQSCVKIPEKKRDLHERLFENCNILLIQLPNYLKMMIDVISTEGECSTRVASDRRIYIFFEVTSKGT